MSKKRWFCGKSLSEALSLAKHLGCRIKTGSNSQVCIGHDSWPTSVRLDSRHKISARSLNRRLRQLAEDKDWGSDTSA